MRYLEIWMAATSLVMNTYLDKMLFPIILIFVNTNHQTNQTKYGIFRLMVHKLHSALRSGGVGW